MRSKRRWGDNNKHYGPLTVSDVCNYGTLSTTFVREHCDRIEAALRTPRPESDARDAARYRWLRAQHWNDADICVVAHPKGSVKLGTDCPSLERLDAAIDAALTQPEATR